MSVYQRDTDKRDHLSRAQCSTRSIIKWLQMKRAILRDSWSTMKSFLLSVAATLALSAPALGVSVWGQCGVGSHVITERIPER